MSSRAYSQTCQLVRALLREFEATRAPEFSDHGRRNLVEAAELLRLFFDEVGLRVVDLREDASSNLLDGVTSIDGVCEQLAGLGDPFLGRVLPAEREFSQIVLAVARDFERWLRGREMPGTAPDPRGTPFAFANGPVSGPGPAGPR